MSNYSEVFHKCGDRFRDVTKLFCTDGSFTRVSGTISLTLPEIRYKIHRSFIDENPNFLSSDGLVAKKTALISIVIPNDKIYESFNDSTLSFKTSSIICARVIL